MPHQTALAKKYEPLIGMECSRSGNAEVKAELIVGGREQVGYAGESNTIKMI